MIAYPSPLFFLNGKITKKIKNYYLERAKQTENQTAEGNKRKVRRSIMKKKKKLLIAAIKRKQRSSIEQIIEQSIDWTIENEKEKQSMTTNRKGNQRT